MNSFYLFLILFTSLFCASYCDGQLQQSPASSSPLQEEDRVAVRSRRRRNTDETNCPKDFEGKCKCKSQPYPHVNSSMMFVVNCSHTHFDNADMLELIPLETEVLIFTGNMLDELDINLFGEDIEPDQLKYIDLSNNHITFIRGQTFHKVREVETLILNFNQMEITEDFLKTRIFSNFANLKHLHLTDTFTDRTNASAYFILTLQDIFEKSTLVNLEKLHLEQNEIFAVGAELFCPLKSLKQLYLADNKLTDMEFKIDCLKKLNYIDLRYNMITRLSEEAMKRLDDFVKGGTSLQLNLKNNPLSCDCRSKKFLDWIMESGVTIRQKEDYICLDGYPEDNIGLNIHEVEHLSCYGFANGHAGGYSSATVGFLSFLIVVMLIAMVALGYYHKKMITKEVIQPIVNVINRKISYSGLANEEQGQEAHV